MVNICPKCRKGLMMPESKAGHVVGDSFVVGNVSKCIRCEHKEVASEVYIKVNVLTEKPKIGL